MGDLPRDVGGVLQAATGFLAGRGIDEARLKTEWLLADTLDCPRLELPQHGTTVLTDPQLDALRGAVRRLARHEPLQYVQGYAEFMGHRLAVDTRVLIPRPETEQLVERVLRDPALAGDEPPVLLDIGTGSGCIAIALALALPNAQCVAIDTSADALAVALENARRLGVDGRVTFTTHALPDFADPEMFDAIVSNPPYIPTREWERLPPHIREFEPRAALDGGPDGLDVIRTIAEDAVFVLKPGARLYLEIGDRQGRAVQALLAEHGFDKPEVVPDLSGRTRFAVAAAPGAEDA